MEIGPLAEWVAGIAELLAVCVALFLPMYNEHKKLQRKIRNLKGTIHRFGQEALDGDRYALRVLDTYLMISYLGNTNGNFETLISQGQVLVDAIKALPEEHNRDYALQYDQIQRQIQQIA